MYSENSNAEDQAAGNHDITDSNYQFNIWPEDSEISQAWHTFIHGKICPSPVSDSKNQTNVDFTGRVIDLGNAVQVEYFAIRPNGTQMKLDNYMPNPGYDFCQEGVNTALQMPDSAGQWSVYGIAKWVSNGSIREVKSNTATIQVQPPLYQSNQFELLDNDTSIERLLDWSRDGKSVLVTYFKTPEDRNQYYHISLGILDATALTTTDTTKITPIELPENFQFFWDSRFSPSDSSKILIVGDTNGTYPYNLFVFNLGDKQLKQIANSTETNALNSAVWLPNQSATSGDAIVYGEEVHRKDDGRLVGYNIWQTDQNGQNVKKLFEKSILPVENIFIYDASSDGNSILFGDIISPQLFFSKSNMTILDLDNQHTRVVFNTYSVAIPRFSPSADLILFDIPTGDKTPGGPIEVIGLDGGIHEVLKTGQEKPGDDPSSFVISPDGTSMLVNVLQWTSGPMRLYKAEFAHPIPEFGDLNFTFLLVITVSAAALVIMQKFKIPSTAL